MLYRCLGTPPYWQEVNLKQKINEYPELNVISGYLFVYAPPILNLPACLTQPPVVSEAHSLLSLLKLK